MIKIWLDDRKHPPKGWIHTNTAASTIDLLIICREAHRIVDVLSLDHDLGNRDKVGDGEQVVRYIEAYLSGITPDMRKQEHVCPLHMRIHSANPVGRANMDATIASIHRLRGH